MGSPVPLGPHLSVVRISFVLAIVCDPWFVFLFGNRQRCSIWFDSLLVGFPILQHFSSADADSFLHARVEDFLRLDGTWDWPSNSRALVELASQIYLIVVEVGLT